MDIFCIFIVFIGFITCPSSAEPSQPETSPASDCETYIFTKDNMNEMKEKLRNKLLAAKHSRKNMDTTTTIPDKKINDEYLIHLGVDEMNFTAASSACKENSSQLAIIPNMNDFRKIVNDIRKKYQERSIKFWTGMTFDPIAGKFTSSIDQGAELQWRLHHKWVGRDYRELVNIILHVENPSTSNNTGVVNVEPSKKYYGLICAKRLGLQKNP